MPSPLPALFATILSLAIGSFTLADDPKPAGDNPRRERPAGERPQGEPRPAFARLGRFGLGIGGPGSVNELMMVLSELNMSPDFTLSKEQKEKIHGIREEFMKQQETWRTGHEEGLKKLQAQFSELRGGGEANRDKIQEIGKAQDELFATAPKGEEQVKEIKALLSPEQAKELEERLSKRREGGREGRAQGAGGDRPRGEGNAKPGEQK